jgi:hypothetical protein
MKGERRADPAALADNAGVLRYLGQGVEPNRVLIEQPPPTEIDRWHLGSHPDVVERLWDVLNAALPGDARALVAGGAALIDPASGRVLAVALGTAYALWLAPARRSEAHALGRETVHEFHTVGRTLDLSATFGPGWFFGAWAEAERGWLVESQRAANL